MSLLVVSAAEATALCFFLWLAVLFAISHLPSPAETAASSFFFCLHTKHTVDNSEAHTPRTDANATSEERSWVVRGVHVLSFLWKARGRRGARQMCLERTHKPPGSLPLPMVDQRFFSVEFFVGVTTRHTREYCGILYIYI